MITGKSATGKDLIYRKLLEEDIRGLTPLVIHTTRPMRSGEQDGREYHFTDEASLQEMRKAGKVIEERVYPTVHGNWYYFTADDGQIDLEGHSYLVIGTLAACMAMKAYFGSERIVPLYIEVSDETRIRRAVEREAGQKVPAFSEVCRRYLADEEDFSEENIRTAGVVRRFSNDGKAEDCVNEIRTVIEADLKEELS